MPFAKPPDAPSKSSKRSKPTRSNSSAFSKPVEGRDERRAYWKRLVQHGDRRVTRIQQPVPARIMRRERSTAQLTEHCNVAAHVGCAAARHQLSVTVRELEI